jgi:putative peptide zinc metalloprotease protein
MARPDMKTEEKAAPSETLPKLRTDLQFITDDEAMIYDPLLHRYMRLDGISLAVLKALSQEQFRSQSWTQADLLNEAQRIFGNPIPATSLALVLKAAAANNLLQTRQGDSWKAAANAAKHQQEKGWKWLLHNYISLRIPLIQPEPYLGRIDAVLRAIFSPATAMIMPLLGLLTLFLVSRQWTEFSLAIRGLTEAPMLLGLGMTILVVKLWHEIGHGHFARRYGCRVPSAGILLILGAPLFYTDVTDAWRLKTRRQRMMIAGAGVMAEAILAILALFLWVFLKDGLVRNIAFFVASGSLITTLLINLSPFMRFDGYFLLSDGLRIPNLHDRAFEAMKWYLRRFLLGFSDPLPQPLQGLHVGWLAVFGAATALYRLLLFVGIAVFVYHAFFKLAGLFLFAIEIAWFILKPLNKELQVWKVRHKEIRWFSTGGRTVLAVITALLLLFMPLSRSISLKAVLEPSGIARAHAFAPAIIESIHVSQGQKVVQGDILLQLYSPLLSHQKAIVETRLALVRARLARVAADQAERGQLNVLIEEERSLLAQHAGVQAELSALVIRAPMTGIVVELDREIHAGRAVAVKDRLVLIGSEKGLSARGFTGSESIERIKAPALAVFVAENPLAPRLPLTLAHIGAAPSAMVEPPALALALGGDVPSSADRSGRNTASVAAYSLVFNSDGSPPLLAIRGTIHVTAAAESLGLRALKRAVSIIVRESGV